MTENVSDSGDLSAKQQLFIVALLTPMSIEAASRTIGIADKTAHRWLKLTHVQQALKDAKQQIYQAAIQELQLGLQDAIRGLKRHMLADVEPNSATQIKALIYWIDKNILLEDIEALKAKIALIEQIHSKKDK